MKTNKLGFFSNPQSLFPNPQHLCLLLILLMANLVFSQTVWDGTADTDWYNDTETEFTITTAEQLAGLAELVNDGNNFSGKTIAFGNDIVLNDTTGWEDWETNTPDYEWIAIGTESDPFQGTFNGKGNVISGIYINAEINSSYHGLFGYVNGGTIKNIGVEASYIIGDTYAGGLVGYQNGGTINNSYVSGAVSGNYLYVGGLVGYQSGGTISNSYVSGAVSGYDYVGGLVGYQSGIISNSYVSGAVSGYYYVGGLVGYQSGGTISNGYVSGAVSGTNNWVGGLVGYQGNNSTVSNSYYDKETSGQVDVGKGIPKTTEEMQSEEFVDTLNIMATALSMNAWIYSTNEYPTLSNETATIDNYFASGDGTVDNPYIIKTKQHLENLSWLVNFGRTFNSEYIKLGNDIALNDTADWQNWKDTPPENEWIAIGTGTLCSFQGTFDGNGHVISGIYINTSFNVHQGLFGYVNGGTIKNLGVEAFYVNGNVFIGGLVGYQSGGTISNSYVSGAVSGSNEVGGLVGNQSGGIISNSFATGAVSGIGGSSFGGLVGYQSDGTISNSFATGAVSGSYGVGGLVGSSYGTVSNSYATGVVSGSYGVGGLVGYQNNGTIIVNSYYDEETSRQSDTGKGEGKTTEEMKQQETFVDWDFEDIWNIENGITYPYFIKKTDLSICTIADIDTQIYTGTNITPTVYINCAGNALIESTNYNVVFTNNINAGTATVTVTGNDNYNDTLTANFTINPKALPTDAIQSIDEQTHTGSDIIPDVIVKDGSVTLVEGIDYDIAFTNNTNEGTANVTVTGKGNYSGIATADFTIDTQTPIRLPQIANSQINVKAINGGILLENLPSNAKVELYNLQGKQVYLGNSGNSQILKILIQTKGVYIAKVGKQTLHVVAK